MLYAHSRQGQRAPRRRRYARRALWLERLEGRWQLAVANPVVNDLGDGNDYDLNDGVCAATFEVVGDPAIIVPNNDCTLQAAADNADASPGLDIVTFSVPAGSVIATRGVTFTEPVALDGGPGKIVLTNAPGTRNTGLTVFGGPGSVVRNLVFNGFDRGLTVGRDTLVVGNHFGVNLAGTAAAPNIVGISVFGEGNNVIGGVSAEDRNIISGNTDIGIHVAGSATGTAGIRIIGNYIGTDVTGMIAIGNGLTKTGNAGQGIRISAGTGIIVGGPGAEGNVISGNRIGVMIDAGGNYVVGNKIGTTADGAASLGNIEAIEVFGANNVIGGDLPGGGDEILGNVIAASVGDPAAGIFGAGVHVIGATGTRIQGNRIGTDPTGILAMPNQSDGVSLNGASNSLVGGTTAPARNLISGNNGDGVFIGTTLASGANNNVIEGNYIGVDATGAEAMSNGARGVHIDSNATGNIIGGDALGSRNVISGNNLDGVIIALAGATGNVVKGNFIGTDVTGMVDVGNGRNGILILRASNNVIGETSGTSFVRNLISGNGRDGVRIDGTNGTASGNVVAGNLIGTDAEGNGRIQNDLSGVYIVNAASNIVGGAFTEPPDHLNFLGNTISGNADNGVKIEGATAAGNLIGANLIGTTSTGLAARGNIGHGILILNAPDNRIGAGLVGDPSLTGNTISANLNGIKIQGATATGNVVGGNLVGTDYQGRLNDFLDNSVHGVWIVDAADNSIGGVVSDGTGGGVQLPGNTIANSGSVGVKIQGDTATGNRVQRNSIFANHGMGLDLGGDGVTPNDELDVDGNTMPVPNRLQNFPELFSLHPDGTLVGVLRSMPNTTFTIDLYRNEQEDPSGNGEGQAWIADQVATTDAGGVVFFEFPLHADLLRGQQVLTATATDPAGNTSEFSGPLRLADLEARLVEFTAADIERRGNRFFLPYEAAVANIGTLAASDVLVRVSGNGQILDNRTLTLTPAAVADLSGEWDVTDLFPQGELGARTLLTLLVEVDPLDAVPEMIVGANTAMFETTVDPRPRIVKIESEFKPDAYYLNGVSLPNRFDLTVDWNGDLDDSQISADQGPYLNVFAGGTVIASQPVANPFDKGKVSVDLGEDLSSDDSSGLKLVQFRADTNLHGFFSEYSTLQFNVFDSVDWINVDAATNPFWTVSGTPEAAQYDRTAVYKASVLFPQLGTQGVFGIPVDRVGFAGGAFGPYIPQFAVRTELRSDRTSSVEGEVKWEADVAGKSIGAAEFGSLGGAISAKLKGDLQINDHQLELDPTTLTLKLEGNLTTPKVPFPPPLMVLKAQGKISLGVDATVELTEALNAQTGSQELRWKEDVVLGLEPTAEAIVSIGQSGVATLEAGAGLKMRGEFELDGDPCIEKSALVNLFVRMKATFLVFAAQKTWVFPFLASSCSGAAAGEGDLSSAMDQVATDVTLIPRWDSPAPDPEGETASVGLPPVSFPYAKPALARHTDGTMTLVYISDDPAKIAGQQLEVFSSRWDGAAWSPVVQLTDDTLLDDAPAVAYDANGNAVALWSRVKNPVADAANTDPLTLRSDMEIVSAVFHAATQTWSAPTPVTDNAVMDLLPQLQADAAGNVMAVWLRDQASDTPIFPEDATPLGADVVYSQWNGTVWSVPAVAVGNVAVTEAPQLALGNGSGLLVWSEDGDRNGVTGTDRDLQAATWNGSGWSAPTVLSGAADGVADVLPRLAFDSQNRAHLTWVKAGVAVSEAENDSVDQLWYTPFQNGGFGPHTLAVQALAISDPSMVIDGRDQPSVAWQALAESGPDIFVSTRDAGGGAWSPRRQITASPELEWWLNPFINGDGQLEVLYLERALAREPAPNASGEGETNAAVLVPTFTTSRLTTVARALGPDLAIEALSLTPENPSPGAMAQVLVTIQNRGDLATPPSTVALRDDGTLVGSTMVVPGLVAGGRVQVAFDWMTPPAATAPRALRAEVDPDQTLAERDEANNTATLTVLKPDLAIELVDTLLAEDTITVTVSMENRGGSPTRSPFDVQLWQDEIAAGLLLGTQTVTAPLAVGARSIVTFTILNALATIGGLHTGLVVADSGAAIAELDEANNRGFAALDPRRRVEFLLPASGSPFRVRRDGDNVVVTRQDSSEFLRESLAGLTRLTLSTTTANQQVIVDHTSGDPAPAEGLVVIASRGNDRLSLQGGGSRRVVFHGGTGQNALQVLSGNVTLNLTDPAERGLFNLQQIDIRGTGPNSLTLNKTALDEVTGAANELRVLAQLGDSVSPGTGWQLTGTQVADGIFLRVLEQTGSRLLLGGPADWQHPLNRYDVNNSGAVEPLDALHVINELNEPRFRDSSSRLADAASLADFPDLFFDVVPDGLVVPLDVLVVINFLNNRSGQPEGEADAAATQEVGLPTMIGSTEVLGEFPNTPRLVPVHAVSRARLSWDARPFGATPGFCAIDSGDGLRGETRLAGHEVRIRALGEYLGEGESAALDDLAGAWGDVDQSG